MKLLTKISLFFDVFIDKELENKVPAHAEIIRLWCLVQFRKKKDWTIPYPALIDTGAHTAIIPKKIWSDLSINKIAKHYVRGLIPKEECKLDIEVGEVELLVCDKVKHTNKMQILCYLAPVDNIPLILGFKDLLSKFNICFDYDKNNAYIDTKR